MAIKENVVMAGDTQSHIEQLKLQLREALFLDLDDFGLEEQESNEFTACFWAFG